MYNWNQASKGKICLCICLRLGIYLPYISVEIGKMQVLFDYPEHLT